jgi:aminopeptidase 2
MGATENPELIQKTFDFVMTKSRDQDTLYFFRGLVTNFKTRRALAQFFQKEYDGVRIPRYGRDQLMCP